MRPHHALVAVYVVVPLSCSLGDAMLVKPALENGVKDIYEKVLMIVGQEDKIILKNKHGMSLFYSSDEVGNGINLADAPQICPLRPATERCRASAGK